MRKIYILSILIFSCSTEPEQLSLDCTDIDGNDYATVQIGNQLWMSENLKTTHYNNGDEIPNPSHEDWGSFDEGQYCVYDNDSANVEVYGNLYNWAAATDDRGVCPENFHVPTDEEYKELEMFLGMSESEANSTGWRGTNEGSKLADGAELWNNGNLENNSEFGTSGFSAFPGGYR
ncbi:MAG: fibrobacter succinogenes major paralogous domain-containing protein, partial [Candidatus Marinimicrobia bacterium]|nr:fibrobacter succinogenes major paralogous domain-containing protein [Candidatus Neomarinimicrobiota bacterium]